MRKGKKVRSTAYIDPFYFTNKHYKDSSCWLYFQQQPVMRVETYPPFPGNKRTLSFNTSDLNTSVITSTKWKKHIPN